MEDDDLPLQARLNLQTARISWPEIERFFARGRVLEVATKIDLIEVATALAEDDTDKFKCWTESGEVAHLNDATAKQWVRDDSNLWAVVVAPWVIAQQRN